MKGKGSESPFLVKQYEYQMKQFEGNLVTDVNAIGRIVLPVETAKFFHDHIKKLLKIAIEITIGERHFIGFIDATELLHVGRKLVRVAVPLWIFNNLILMKNCNYPSAFEFNPIPNARRSKRKSHHRNSGTKTYSSATLAKDLLDNSEISEEIPLMNKCGQQVFIIVELDLEKPLNEEIYEDSHEKLLTNTSSLNCTEHKISDQVKLETFKKQLALVIKHIRNIYDKEKEVDKIVTKMISDGYFRVICHTLGHIKSELPNFDELQLSSSILNRNFVVDMNREIFQAKVYQALGMDDASNEIFLRQIYENSCEDSYIHYAIHNLRKEKFSKCLVCIDKAMTFNEQSIIGHILKTYVLFKEEKYSESGRLIEFMQYKHGDSTELSVIQHLISNQKVREQMKPYIATLFYNEQLETHPKLDQLYKSHEVLWFATDKDEDFLNWQDPLIRTAILCIKLGCYDFAELALNEHYDNHGVDINLSYLLAVIGVMKGNIQNSLVHLNKILNQQTITDDHQPPYDKILVLKSIILLKSNQYNTIELISLS